MRSVPTVKSVSTLLIKFFSAPISFKAATSVSKALTLASLAVL
nr:MAG TPA: hypothetical protein [Caudoviricetes sp.]